MYFSENHYHFFPTQYLYIIAGMWTVHDFLKKNSPWPGKSVSCAVFGTKKLVRSRECVAVSETGSVGVASMAGGSACCLKAAQRLGRGPGGTPPSFFLMKKSKHSAFSRWSDARAWRGLSAVPACTRTRRSAASLLRRGTGDLGRLLFPRPCFCIPRRSLPVLTGVPCWEVKFYMDKIFPEFLDVWLFKT